MRTHAGVGGILTVDRAKHFARHDLIVVARATWDDTLRSGELARFSREQVMLLSTWAERRWPVMVRRPLSADRPGEIPIGIPLPPSAGKARIALSLPGHADVVRLAPLSLSDAADAAPKAWRETLTALDCLGQRFDAFPRVFGALLWQRLTGLAYLRDQSDLDCLWSPPAANRIALLDALRTIAATAPMDLDGEIILEDGGGVSWRELDRARLDPEAEVVVKSMDGLSLRRANILLDDARV